jgi:L-threonylcarbamoyladenylate synthase
MRRISDRDPIWLNEAAEVLARGGLVAFPTDTVYGVGCHAFRPAAIQRLYAAKERPRDKAIPLLIADPRSLLMVARHVPDEAALLACRFWPGGLTLVLPRSQRLPTILTGGEDSVAVRVPDHEIPLSLIRKLGAPLAASSANRSGHPAPIEAEAVERELGDRIELLIDGGACPGGVASTVLDLTSRRLAILREGAITRETLQAVLGTSLLQATPR